MRALSIQLRGCLVGACIATALPFGCPAGPAIVCDHPVFDFGRQFADGAEPAHVFILRNAGDDVLEIHSVESGCGCAQARPEHKLIPAGAQTRLDVRINLRGRAGLFARDVVVRSNDRATPELRLKVTGFIESPYELSPTAAMFGVIAPGAVATQSVDVIFGGHDPVRIESVAPEAPWLEADAAEIEPGRRWRITVRTRPPYPDGASWLGARVRIATTHPQVPEIVFAATATVTRELSVTPSEWEVDADARTPVFRHALIRPGGAGRIDIVSIHTPDPSMRADSRVLADGSIQIVVRGIRAVPELDGQAVTIVTDPPAGGPHRIPFRLRRAGEEGR